MKTACASRAWALCAGPVTITVSVLCRSDNIDPCALLKNKSLAALQAMEELVKLAREEIRAFSIQEEEE